MCPDMATACFQILQFSSMLTVFCRFCFVLLDFFYKDFFFESVIQIFSGTFMCLYTFCTKKAFGCVIYICQVPVVVLLLSEGSYVTLNNFIYLDLLFLVLILFCLSILLDVFGVL